MFVVFSYNYCSLFLSRILQIVDASVTPTPIAVATPPPTTPRTTPPTPPPTQEPTGTPTVDPTPSPTIPPTADPTPAPVAAPTPTEYESLGCFVDSKMNRIMSGKILADPMSAEVNC